MIAVEEIMLSGTKQGGKAKIQAYSAAFGEMLRVGNNNAELCCAYLHGISDNPE